MRLWFEPAVLSKLQQARHGRASLRRAEHARLRQPARRALTDHRRWVVVKDSQQRRDGGVGRQVRQAFHRPIADVHVLVAGRCEEDIRNPLLVYAPVANERKVLQGVGSGALCSEASFRFEAVDGCRVLVEVARGDVHFEARHSDRQIA